MSTRNAVSAIAGALLREALRIEQLAPIDPDRPATIGELNEYQARSLRALVADLNSQLEQW